MWSDGAGRDVQDHNRVRRKLWIARLLRRSHVEPVPCGIERHACGLDIVDHRVLDVNDHDAGLRVNQGERGELRRGEVSGR